MTLKSDTNTEHVKRKRDGYKCEGICVLPGEVFRFVEETIFAAMQGEEPGEVSRGHIRVNRLHLKGQT